MEIMKKMKIMAVLMIGALYTSVAIGVEPHATAVSGSISGAGAASESTGYVANEFSYSSVNNANNKDLAPTLFAPALAGGTNPCIVSASAGISTGGFGITGGSAYVDKECEVRESLRLMAAISNATESANQTLLREIACQSIVYWDAMERTSSSLDDPRYHCLNPRPSERTYVRVREEGNDVLVTKRKPIHDDDYWCDDYNDECY